MDITTVFFLYAALFRLTIIVVGAVSIFLGYLLFVKDPIGQGKTSAIAEAGGFKLTLKNFWPGAYFALFGTIIIGIMLWQGNPQLVINELKDANNIKNGKSDIFSRQLTIRGSDTDQNIAHYWEKLSDPELPLVQASKPISDIARIWKKEHRTSEALAFARLAAQINPKNAEYLALLAELFQANGEHDKALKAIQAAAELDPSYQGALSNLQKSVKEE